MKYGKVSLNVHFQLCNTLSPNLKMQSVSFQKYICSLSAFNILQIINQQTTMSSKMEMKRENKLPLCKSLMEI